MTRTLLDAVAYNASFLGRIFRNNGMAHPRGGHQLTIKQAIAYKANGFEKAGSGALADDWFLMARHTEDELRAALDAVYEEEVVLR